MINLLPPSEQRELLLDRTKKLVIVLGNVVLISLVALILVLFSVKFYILGEIGNQKEVLADVQKQYQTPDFLFFKDLISKYNSSLLKVSSYYKKEIRTSEAFKMLAAIQKPTGLHLTDIKAEQQRNNVKVNISGISDTRENLLLFKETIEHSDNVKNVYFPANNWIKAEDVTFYLTFDYQHENK